MTVVFAAALAAGFILLVVWTVLRGVGDGCGSLMERLPPFIAAGMAFGLAGLSASYAGTSVLVSIAAAVAGALAALGWVIGTRAIRRT
ncbi:MAG: hypothetical protein ACE5MI_12795 [Acidimicrobiia bacterium]